MSVVWIMLPVYLIICLYVRWQLIWWLKKTEVGSRHSQRPLAFILLLLDAVPIVGAFLPECTAQAYCQLFGNVWVGFMVAGAICILLANIVVIIKKESITPRIATFVMVFVVVATCAYNAYGYLHAQDIRTHYYKVRLEPDGAELVDENENATEETLDTSLKPGEVPALNSTVTTRIALIADLHMGVNTQPKTIKRMVDKVCESEPDIVIGAGDYFTSSYTGLADADWYAKTLSEMAEATDGEVYCAYGNHDVTEPLFCGFAIKKPCDVKRYSDMENFFKKCGWHMMSDEYLDRGSFNICFRKDASKTGDGINKRKDVASILADADQAKPLIVVQHEPEDFEECPAGSLVLSGHTHDGQIWPGNWFTRAVADNAHGYKDIDNVSSIVTSGVGYFGPPLRVGTYAEIVVIDVVTRLVF